MSQIRVLVADDHPVVRYGLRLILSMDPELQVVGEAPSGRDCLAAVRNLRPDVVLLDFRMPDMNAIDVIRHLGETGYDRPPVLVLTAYESEQYALQVLDAGAAGFLLKNVSHEELRSAIKRVASGERYVDPKIAPALLSRVRPLLQGIREGLHNLLSERELQILQLLALGYSNATIAAQLFVSPNTVKTHLKNLFRHLDVTNRTAAVTKGLDLNLITRSGA